jgi:DHA2 family multidrug resistance protein
MQGSPDECGLADIRGALHLGIDEGAWMNTRFNACMMFIGSFSVYLGGLLGPRRVLWACARIFTAVSFMIPFCHSLEGVIPLLIIAGHSARMFCPLTLSFVLRSLPMRFVLLGIAIYATDIIFTTDMAQVWESFLAEHLSWHWIFWNGTILTPIMIALVHFGIPWQPLPKPLGLQVRQQASTLAISDSFLLLTTCCVACLVVVSFMSKVPTQYRQVTAAPVEVK